MQTKIFNLTKLSDILIATNYFIKNKKPEIINGVCVILLNGNNDVLILKNSKRSSWELIKGKIEGNENDTECGKREINEESGISDAKYIGKLPIKNEFSMIHSKKMYRKIYNILIFRTISDKITLEDGFSDYKFLKFEDARKIITWKDQKKIIDYLIKNNKFL